MLLELTASSKGRLQLVLQAKIIDSLMEDAIYVGVNPFPDSLRGMTES